MLFVSCLLMTACSSDSEIVSEFTGNDRGQAWESIDYSGKEGFTAIPEIPMSDEAEKFFAEILNYGYTGSDSQAFFAQGFFEEERPGCKRIEHRGEDSNGDIRYYIINSEEQLAAIYRGQRELPKIDFQDKSLILGEYETWPYCSIEKDVLYRTDGGMFVMNLYIPQPAGDTFTCDMRKLCFWGLYPRISAEELSSISPIVYRLE